MALKFDPYVAQMFKRIGTYRRRTPLVSCYYCQITYPKKINEIQLTQNRSAWKPGIRECEAPMSCKYWKKTSSSSRDRIPSSIVSITLFACAASSSEVACSSLVFSSLNFVNMPNKPAFSSKSLQEDQSIYFCF